MEQAQEKPIIYQIFPRIFTNDNDKCRRNGTLEQNGSGHLADYDETMFASLKDLGVNTLWMTGVIEHATKTDFSSIGINPDNPNIVKGEAGSPYAIKDYYDVDPAICANPKNRLKEFESFVERAHKAGMKVIIDLVPNHTARLYNSDAAPKGVEDFGKNDNKTCFFSPSNNYYYIPNQQFSPDFPLDSEGDAPYIEFPAKATGNDCYTAFCTRNDWYETVKLNYGHDPIDNTDHFEPLPDTWRKLLDIIMYWASKGVDGFRCDMVFMVPLAFWHWVIPKIKEKYRDIVFIGEIYDVSLYRAFIDWGGFDYLYDKVNLYDTLVGIEKSNVSAARLTQCWQTVDGIGDRMLNFLENHDEVRFGSDAYAGNPANVLPSLVVSAMISKGPFMIYYGQELGESAHDNEGFAGDNRRSTIFDYWSYDTMRRWYNHGRCDGGMLTQQEKWLRDIYRRVLRLCNEENAIRNGGFFDLMYVNLNNQSLDPHRQFAFIRYCDECALLIVANFDTKAHSLKINIPDLAFALAGLPEGDFICHDILGGSKMPLCLKPGIPVALDVNAKGAVIVKISKTVN